MNKWFSYANEYVKQSDWKDFACQTLACALRGLMIGISLTKKAKKLAAFGAMAVFIATYLPLIIKFLRIVTAGQTRNKSFTR